MSVNLFMATSKWIYEEGDYNLYGCPKSILSWVNYIANPDPYKEATDCIVIYSYAYNFYYIYCNYTNSYMICAGCFLFYIYIMISILIKKLIKFFSE